MMNHKTLRAEKEINVRFSEVDSMGIVWHGNYATYFEDAREVFGRLYHLEYLYIFEKGCKDHFQLPNPARRNG